MKKVLVIIATTLFLAGCGLEEYNAIEVNPHFDYAYIKMADGSLIEGEIASWTKSDNNIIVTFVDGNRYFVNTYNCTLVGKIDK